MSKDARKNEKQRLKRKQKQREIRRAAAVTPLQRLAREGGRLECYVHDGWEEGGMATLQVLGHAPGGKLCHAAFLVDTWCVGLKDAFGRREIARLEFDEMLDRMSGMMDMVPLDPAEAKRLVAGAIRFSRRNGFRLPPHYDRWTAIFGDLGDIDSADLTGFGVEGGRLRYVGDEQFLRRRLIGCTVDEFLDRPDVEWVSPEGVPLDVVRLAGQYLGDGDEDDEDTDEAGDVGLPGVDFADVPELEQLTEILSSVGDRAEDAVRTWCFRNGQAPQPRLREAINTLLLSATPMMVYEQAAEEDPSVLDEEGPPDPRDMLDSAMVSLPEPERQSLEAAMAQVAGFMRQFKDPREMIESLALPEALGKPGSAPPPPPA